MQQHKGFFITGTDTNVGKTWVATRLIQAILNQGQEVSVKKPIESGWNKTQEKQTDAWALAQAANQLDQLDQVCRFRFKAAISPARAAQLEHRSITTQQVLDECFNSINPNHYLMVEGAGGFYSPLTCDGLNADLAKGLNLPVILVVNNRLGCINHALLTYRAILHQNLTCSAVLLNNINPDKPLAMDNLADLSALIDAPVIDAQSSKAMQQLLHYLSIPIKSSH